MSRLLPALILAAFLPACGGNDDASGDDDDDTAAPDASVPPDAPSGPLEDQLAGLPGVVSVTELPTENEGYRRFDIRMEQPVDASAPDGATFVQQMTLFHRDTTAPMILLSTGYWNYNGDRLGELAVLLHANQLVVEHRYFGDSRPENADWSKLTIENAAHDHHKISVAFHRIYGAKWLATGASKGGMTSVYHRRFWPDDVDGTVPYVAPISFGAPDMRYDAFVDAIGTAPCRQALQDLEVELLRDRRAMLEQRATAQAEAENIPYTRVAIGPAVEGSVASIYWAFWQYYGADFCQYVPPTTASDDDVWEFLDWISPVSDNSDDAIASFDTYYYQASFELGYPGTTDDWLEGLTQYTAEDYAGTNPVGVDPPTYRPEAMQDVDGWVQADGSRLLFVYGQWDPWSGGMFALGDATDSLMLTVPMATHGARLTQLPSTDRAAAFAKLQEWTGVEPDVAGLVARRLAGIEMEAKPPKMPPAVRRALTLRAR
jgi:hypothetical protein